MRKITIKTIRYRWIYHNYGKVLLQTQLLDSTEQTQPNIPTHLKKGGKQSLLEHSLRAFYKTIRN